MSPRETIAFLLTAPSKSQAVNGFVGLAGAQMGLKYGFMSLFCIVKGQQEQEIIAELLIYDGRRPFAPLDPVSPLIDASRGPGCRECGGACASASLERASLGVGHPTGGDDCRLDVPSTAASHSVGTPMGRPSIPREGCPGGDAGMPVRRGRAVAAAWAGPAPRAALSCFANPAWHLPQLPAASREQRNQLILPALGEVGQARQALPLTRGEARRGPARLLAGWLAGRVSRPVPGVPAPRGVVSG